MPASIRHLKQLFSDEKAPIVLLAQWPDNKLYYVVKLLKLDEKKGKCQVRYEDGTECSVSTQDLHIQLNTSMPDENDYIFCCLCDKSDSDPPNEVILCDTCQQGYHQHCHVSPIQQIGIESSSEEWSCHTCEYIMSQLNPIAKTSTPKVKSRLKRESPRRAVLKMAQSKKSGIKLKLSSKDNKNDKKSSQESTKIKQSQESDKNKQSQESTKTKRVAPAAKKDEIIEEPAQRDSSDESPGLLGCQVLTGGAVVEGGDHDVVIETAKGLAENLGTSTPTLTNDFVDAIAETAEPKSKTKLTNGKPTKKAVTKKKSAKVPVPPA